MADKQWQINADGEDLEFWAGTGSCNFLVCFVNSPCFCVDMPVLVLYPMDTIHIVFCIVFVSFSAAALFCVVAEWRVPNLILFGLCSMLCLNSSLFCVRVVCIFVELFVFFVRIVCIFCVRIVCIFGELCTRSCVAPLCVDPLRGRRGHRGQREGACFTIIVSIKTNIMIHFSMSKNISILLYVAITGVLCKCAASSFLSSNANFPKS